MSADVADRAARRHWERTLNRLVREDYWHDLAAGHDDGAPIIVRRTLDADLAGRIDKAARGRAVLRHTMVTAALAAVFGAYSGHDTVTLATPPMRGDLTEPEPEPNVLPIVIPVSAGGTGRELLARTREALLQGYAAQECPYDWMIGLLDPSGDASRARCPLAGWVVRDAAIHGELPSDVLFDGVLEVAAADLTITADPALLRYSTVTHLLDVLVDVIDRLTAAPDEPVTPGDRSGEVRAEDLRVAGSQPLPPAQSVLAGFRQVAATHPDRTAVVAPDGVLTYGQLARRSAAVGWALRGTQGMVALFTGQTAATVVGALGALQAGVPYVVASPDTADLHRLGERGVTVGLTGDREPIPGYPGIALQSLAELAEGATGPLPDPHPSTLAYAILTSGSTGMAKTVLVSHGNLAASTAARREVYGPGTMDFLLLSPFTFDSSVAGTYWTLAGGGILHIAPPEVVADPVGLLGHAGRCRAIATLGLPRVLESLARAAADGELAGLGLVIGAGEEFPASLVSTVRRAAPQARIVNEYGPSEATVWATWHEATGDESDVPIGRPVPGTRVHVLGADGQPVPPGLAGQLAIGGPQVSQGYLGDARRTAECFGPDPFSAEPGGRLYFTGDYGWVDDAGAIHFLGRRDDEIKIRGMRVRLSDVNAELRAHPAVVDAESVARDGQLIAFVTSRDPDLEPDTLRADLRGVLSAAALPARVLRVPEIPRLSNGKPDVTRLLTMTASGQASGPSRPPADTLEEFLLDRFRAVLGDPPPGGKLNVDSNFFAVGGDSIKAALLVAQLSRELDTYLYVVAILDHSTVAGLAEYLRDNYGDAVRKVVDGGLTPTAEAGAEAVENPAEAADAQAETDFRALVATRRPVAVRQRRDSLPRAVFVLAPPRSGTTLMRVLLGGHPALFSPPELELLHYDTLAQRRADLSGRYAFYQEGLIRAVMALRNCTADEATAFLDTAADDGWTAADAYAWLVERAGDRILVDKTASYALDPATLVRAEELFDEPRYIWLTRHPQASITSFVGARLDQMFLRAARNTFSARQLAELMWRVCQSNIATFTDRVDAARVLHVAFEDLVAHPRVTAERLCGFLGVQFDESMLDVHADRTARMTDGVRANGHMLGDIKFHEHQGINPAVAERWQTDDPVPLHTRTFGVARELGYTEGGRVTTYPLSPAQRRMWFLEQLHPALGLYNVPVALQGEGRLDPAAVSRALNSVTRRHHAFRSLVVAPDGDPSLRFTPDLRPELRITEVPAADQARVARELAFEPFALDRTSAARLHLLADRDRFTLLFVVHHLVVDAPSLQLIIGDFLAAYAAWREDRAPDLVPLTRQPAEAAGDELARVQPAALDRARVRLSDPPMLSLPSIRSAAGPFAPAHSVTLPIDLETARAVREYSASRGCTIYQTMLAAFAWTLHRWTGDVKFCVGMPGRTRGPVDDTTVGMFLNTTSVLIDLAGLSTYDEIVSRNEQAVRDAVADAEVPFDDLVNALGLRGIDRNPLIQAMFSVQEAALPLDRCPDLKLRPLPIDAAHAKFEVCLIVTDEGGNLIANGELSADYFDATQAQRLVSDFVAAVRDLTADPARPLKPVPDQEAPMDLLSRLDEHVRTQPHLPAVVGADATLDYAELDQAAGALAGALVPGVVAVLLPRGAAAVTAYVAALRAGARYLPLDPKDPAVRFKLLDARATCVVTDEAGLVAVADCGVSLVRIDPQGRVVDGDGGPAGAEDPAAPGAILYLTRRTDRPSLLTVSAEDLAAHAAARAATLDSGDHVGWAADAGSSQAAGEVWAALWAGATLHAAPDAALAESSSFVRWLQRHTIRALFLTGIDAVDLLRDQEPPPSLRMVLVGGEPLVDVTAVAKRWPVRRCFGAVGTVLVADADAAPFALGRPLPGVTATVLGPDGGPLPPGEPGEIALGEARYRTGYLGRIEQDQNFFFAGHVDGTEHPSGLRIDGQEIAAVALRLAGVSEVLAIDTPDRLALLWTGSVDGPDDRALRALLARYLAPEFVPGTVRRVDRLPWDADSTWKLLREPDPTEAQVTEIFADVLGIAAPDPDTSFFALGGSSLLAVRVLARLQKIAPGFPLVRMFREPTVRQVAAAVRALMPAGRAATSPATPAARPGDEVPLTTGQAGLWFADRAAGGAAAYNAGLALRLLGPLDVGALASAVGDLVARHDALRMVCRVDPRGGLWQRSVDDGPRLEVRPAGDVEQTLAEEMATPFVLEGGRLSRFLLLECCPEESVLLLRVHHLVFDAWSASVVLKDLAAAYEARLAGRGNILAPASPSWTACAAATHAAERDDDPEYRAACDYWAALDLASVRPLALAGGGTADPASPVGECEVHLGPDVSAAVRAAAGRLGATPFAIHTTALVRALAGRTGRSDIVVGVDVSQRRGDETDGTAGYFVNVVPLVLHPDPARPDADEVRASGEAIVSAQAHARVPLPRILRLAGVPARGVEPFNVVIAAQPGGVYPDTFGAARPVPVSLGNPGTKYDLTVYLDTESAEMGLVLRYRTGWCADPQVRALADGYRAELRRLVEAEGPAERPASAAERFRRRRAQRLADDGSGSRADRIGGGERLAGATIEQPDRVSGPIAVHGQGLGAEWFAESAPRLRQLLHSHGAVLFRGFAIGSPEEFRSVAAVLCPALHDRYGDLPAIEGMASVYRSTPYPPEAVIEYHNEGSHLTQWPRVQFFYCRVPAPVGGETAVADGRAVLRALPADIRRDLRERGLLYRRHFHEGLDVSWRDFFRCDDPDAVIDVCAGLGMAAEWAAPGVLRVARKATAVRTHAATRQEVPFHQILLFHPSLLDKATRSALDYALPPDQFPRDVRYADGSTIPDEVVAAIRTAYHAVAAPVAWNQGELLMIDNELVAHSRWPFSGPRELFVAMGEMQSCDA